MSEKERGDEKQEENRLFNQQSTDLKAWKNSYDADILGYHPHRM